MINIYRLRWAGPVARMEEGRSAFKLLASKPTGKRPLGRPKRRWEDNIRMDLEGIGINAGNWVDSAQDMNYYIYIICALLILLYFITLINLIDKEGRNVLVYYKHIYVQRYTLSRRFDLAKVMMSKSLETAGA